MNNINGGALESNMKKRHINIKKKEEASEIKKIKIISVFDINILSEYKENVSDIKAHLWGSIETDGEVIFNVFKENDEIKIITDLTENSHNRFLQLDITIPKKIYDTIEFESNLASVHFGREIRANSIKAKTISGDISSNTTFTNASIITNSGDIDISNKAEKDIFMEIYNKNGNITLEFINIGNIDFEISKTSGKIKNNRKNEIGYNANVKIRTLSSNIYIE